MLDPETFLVELYVPVDEFCKAQLPPQGGPGPSGGAVAAARSSRWRCSPSGGAFASERDFWRYATTRLRPLFPLPA